MKEDEEEDAEASSLLRQARAKAKYEAVIVLIQLGKGATAVVDSVWDTSHREEFARKTVRFGRLDLEGGVLAQIRREIKTLSRLRHRHIVSLVDWHVAKDSMELLMSPAADNNLMSLLNADKETGRYTSEPRLREPAMIERVVTWMSCLSSALAYMHSAGVTHGDIKPHNILISGSHAWLGDFGTAEFERESVEGLVSASRWATPMYCPPEVQSRRPRGRPADVWSFGCVLLEVSTWLGGYPVQALREFRGSAKPQPYHVDLDSTLVWIGYLRWSFRLREELRAKEYLLDVLLDMLVIQPESRITEGDVWKRLTRGRCKEGECLCEGQMPPPAADEIFREHSEVSLPGTLFSLRETDFLIDDITKLSLEQEVPTRDMTPNVGDVEQNIGEIGEASCRDRAGSRSAEPRHSIESIYIH